jgi:hypothetical protein
MANDPLSLFAEKFEQYLQDAPAIKRLVKSKNIDAFVSTRGTKENDVAPESDLPRIRLVWTGGPSNLNLASNLASFELGCDVQIVTGDKRFSKDLFPVLWAVLCVTCQAIHDDAICGLEWEGNQFVKNIGIGQVQTGFLSLDGTAQGIKGTTSICSLVAYLYFPQTVMVATNQ